MSLIFGSQRLQTGNALFLILIAVALFAALSYAVTRSGRSSGTIAKEEAQLLAARLVQHAAMMENAVKRVMLVNGCSDTQLNFASAFGFANPTAPSDKRCDIFAAEGGGVDIDQFGATGFYLSGSVNVMNVGSAAPELIYMAFAVGDDFCRLINSRFNGAQPPEADGIAAADPFTGTFATVPTGIIGDEGSNFNAGKLAGCWDTGANAGFFYVLLER